VQASESSPVRDRRSPTELHTAMLKTVLLCIKCAKFPTPSTPPSPESSLLDLATLTTVAGQGLRKARGARPPIFEFPPGMPSFPNFQGSDNSSYYELCYFTHVNFIDFSGTFPYHVRWVARLIHTKYFTPKSDRVDPLHGSCPQKVEPTSPIVVQCTQISHRLCLTFVFYRQKN